MAAGWLFEGRILHGEVGNYLKGPHDPHDRSAQFLSQRPLVWEGYIPYILEAYFNQVDHPSWEDMQLCVPPKHP